MMIRIYSILLIIILLNNCVWNEDEEKPLLEEAGVITFTTEGSSFSPRITVEGNTDIKWTWSDGTTDSSSEPVKVFKNDGQRTHYLKVTPWSALKRINIGYNGEDGGYAWDMKFPPGEPLNDNQNVSRIEGLSYVAPYLERWYSSGNQIQSLDFTNFIKLDTVECYESPLNKVILKNTPSLKRLCLEDADITYPLDLTESPALVDIRGALNNYDSIIFDTREYPELWHLCLRENPLNNGIDSLFSKTDWLPGLGELLIMNMEQTGSLVIRSNGVYELVYVDGSNNYYNTLDLEGSFQDETAMGYISMDNNSLEKLENINLSDCDQITAFYCVDNLLEEAAIDYILEMLDSYGRKPNNPQDRLLPPELTSRENFTLDLRGSGNASPSAQGRIYASHLIDRGWKIYTN